MADPVLSYPISCRGGIDETSTTRELQSKPGYASTLFNFEVTPDGGYRRINGYVKLGDLGKTPDVTETPILGTELYNNGYVLCKGGSVYYTYDGNNFALVNKDIDIETNTSGVSADDLVSYPLIPRTEAGFYNFTEFVIGMRTILIGVCENNAPLYLSTTGTQLDNSTFLYKELSITEGSLTGATQCVKYKDQLVIAGMDTAPTEIYYSDILKPDDFEGANAGSIGFNDIVTGLRLFREVLYVFCRNSIHKVVGLETGSPQAAPVTAQLGCVNGNSIQEIAGDLVFLGPDGLRTLAATERISDIDLSTLTDPIQGRLRRAIQVIDRYDVRSVVIRNKSQYRIFFKPKVIGVSRPPFAFVMFIGRDPQSGALTPQFSELGGFDIASIAGGYVGAMETLISGDTVGNIYFHDQGETFDGKQINFVYETPFFDMQDNIVRKNIRKVVTRLAPEGITNLNMSLSFDYQSPETYDPQPYSIRPLTSPPLYGEAAYGEASYGLSEFPTIETLTEGSGKTVSIRIFPSGLRCDPFSIQGFDVQFVPAGKL